MTDSIKTIARRKEIAEIIKDGIQFSPQCDDYVIHGAINNIEALMERERNKVLDEAIERMDYHPLLNQHFDIIKEVLESLKH